MDTNAHESFANAMANNLDRTTTRRDRRGHRSAAFRLQKRVIPRRHRTYSNTLWITAFLQPKGRAPVPSSQWPDAPPGSISNQILDPSTPTFL